MLLKVLDLLECPACSRAERVWKMEGDITDLRIANGQVQCPQEHQWVVSEEILRLDKQNSDEPMQYLERPKTGFPSSVGEQERLEFLPALEEFVKNLHFDPEKFTKIIGDSILFLKYMKQEEGQFIVVHPEEGILRQLQEIAAKKRIYDKMAFIRATDIAMIGPVNTVDLFPDSLSSTQNNTLTIGFIEQGREVWQGENVTLRAHLQ